MSWFRRNNNNTKPDYTALQLQTSVSTLPVPILWGRSKLAGNLIWYENFQIVPVQAGGKGSGGKGGLGGGGGATSYDYRADLIIALCEGPISGIPLIWKDQSIYAPWYLGFNIFNGTTPQTPWGYLTALYPGMALAYQGTAYVGAASYDLGSSATIGNLNFEILGAFAGTGANGVDADPALVINDFLTNAQFGAGFDPVSIDASTLFGPGGDGSLQTYCRATGIAFSPVLVSQEAGSSILSRWLQLVNCAAVWSAGRLKFVPYGDSAVSSGQQATYQQQFSIPRPVPLSTGDAAPAAVTMCSPAQFVSDGGATYAATGIPLVFIGAALPTAAGAYGMTPNGTYIFAPPDEGKAVVVTFTAAAATSYTPDLAPIYALTDLDFVDEKGNKDPVLVERADVFSLPTIQRIEVSSRSNRYSPVPVEARDQSQIESYGARVASTIQAHEICDEFVIGPIIAQTILQRALYVRTRFTFKLSWEFCLLDPMDIVSITDANLGLSNYPVRIISIEEDDKGLLTVTAEELVTGVSTPQYYPSAGAGNYAVNAGVPAVPVNTPLIFEPPPAATGGVAQVWVGASGTHGGGAAQWGGANVFASVDGATFSQIAEITSPLRQGFLTAPLAATSGWDGSDTLSVNLAESAGALSGTSEAAALQGATLSLVDSELLAYEAATLTAVNAYNLTGLARALGRTAGLSHVTGAPFARLDGAVVKYDLPPSLIGQTLYLKFQSFNAFGGGLQDLSTCAVYKYTPTGAGAAHPIEIQLASAIGSDFGQVADAPTLSDDFGSVTGTVLDAVDLGALTTAAPIAAELRSGFALDLGSVASAADTFDDFGFVAVAVVDVINLGTAP